MQIDWWTLALQTVNFLIVVWLLSRFLYRPVRRMIEAREAADREAAEAAQKKADEADALRAEYERRSAAFAEEQSKRETELHETMQAEREQILTDARAEAEKVRAEAKAGIEEARARALAGLQDEIAGLAREMAARALDGVVLDPVAEVSARLDAQGDAALAQARDELAADGEVTVVAAAPLSDDAQKQLRTALEKRFVQSISLRVESDPALLGGAVLRLPHGVLDLSVAGRLDRAARLATEDADDV